jgi:thiamine kinase-like enzyme
MWDISEISYMWNTHATDVINEYKSYITTYHVTEIESNPIQ